MAKIVIISWNGYAHPEWMNTPEEMPYCFPSHHRLDPCHFTSCRLGNLERQVNVSTRVSWHWSLSRGFAVGRLQYRVPGNMPSSKPVGLIEADEIASDDSLPFRFPLDESTIDDNFFFGWFGVSNACPPDIRLLRISCTPVSCRRRLPAPGRNTGLRHGGRAHQFFRNSRRLWLVDHHRPSPGKPIFAVRTSQSQ